MDLWQTILRQDELVKVHSLYLSISDMIWSMDFWNCLQHNQGVHLHIWAWWFHPIAQVHEIPVSNTLKLTCDERGENDCTMTVPLAVALLIKQVSRWLMTSAIAQVNWVFGLVLPVMYSQSWEIEQHPHLTSMNVFFQYLKGGILHFLNLWWQEPHFRDSPLILPFLQVYPVW